MVRNQYIKYGKFLSRKGMKGELEGGRGGRTNR
jgi:hypothetical protein